MSLIPELKIGLLNAWLPILLFNIFVMAIGRIGTPNGAKRAADTSWYEKKDKKFVTLVSIAWLVQFIYAIWAPLKIGTVWFAVGAVIAIGGFIFHIIANHNYMTASLDKLITKGMYKVSRNPLYLFNDIIMIGISIAAASWIMLVILVINCATSHRIIKAEEKYCIRTYGESYREYTQKAPRYLLFF